jgi:energy-coupling factor transporter transmembrane protein EcfT
MSEGNPLRFYGNPLKFLLLLLASALFVVIGFLMLHDPKASARPFNVVIACAAIGFFGLGVVVFLIGFLHDVVMRRAVLEIDEQGWSYSPPLFVIKQTANWQDIDHVAIYRQRLGQRRTMYYLVVHGVDPRKVARNSRIAARMYRIYPALRETLIAVPLNNLFVRTTPKKVERVLERIRTRYAYELQLYGIDVDAQIRAL